MILQFYCELVYVVSLVCLVMLMLLKGHSSVLHSMAPLSIIFPGWRQSP